MSDQGRKVYSFKSTGETEKDRESRNQKRGYEAPIGFKTPLNLSYDHSSLFDMHKDLASQIRDNFRNMISTNHGERVMLYDFGANLKPLAFELGTDEMDIMAINRIKSTTEKYMPYISLDTFEPIRSSDNESDLAKVGVRITYSIPSLLVTNQVVEAVIYAGG